MSYEDIIHLPHHVSTKHPQMALIDRAAQFSPFAALTGHGAAIQETARLTDKRIELDENQKEQLDFQMQILQQKLSEQPQIIVTYFCPDEKKSGGAYKNTSGIVKKIDSYQQEIVLLDGRHIPISDIYELEIEC